MKGQVVMIASGRASYDVYEAGAELVFPVATIIEQEFKYAPAGLPVMTFEGPIVRLERDGAEIWVSWDNWSGLFVMAMNEQADPDIPRVATCVDGRLDGLARREEVPRS